MGGNATLAASGPIFNGASERGREGWCKISIADKARTAYLGMNLRLDKDKADIS